MDLYPTTLTVTDVVRGRGKIQVRWNLQETVVVWDSGVGIAELGFHVGHEKEGRRSKEGGLELRVLGVSWT